MPSVRPALRSLAAAVTLFAGTSAHAATATFTQPGLDRWMYPFAFTGGTRETASVFSSLNNPGFDDRDAQFILGYNTAAGGVPTGLGAGNYTITSARLTVTDAAGNFFYDADYDPVATYRAGGTDADAGRPLEVHGVGFRNGFQQLSFLSSDAAPPNFKENTSFGTQSRGTRNAYALGFDEAGNPRDVSNNVGLAAGTGFESNPWAVGLAEAGVADGSLIPAGAETSFTFDLNVADPSVQSYLRDALNAGRLGLTVSGLLTSGGQENPSGVPQFYTKESAAHAPQLGSLVAPQLELTYTVVPEPSAMAAALAFGLVGLTRRQRRTQQKG